jgi:hypothetical protein
MICEQNGDRSFFGFSTILFVRFFFIPVPSSIHDDRSESSLKNNVVEVRIRQEYDRILMTCYFWIFGRVTCLVDSLKFNEKDLSLLPSKESKDILCMVR